MCSFSQICLCVVRRPPHEAAGRRQQPSRLRGGLPGLPPHEETRLLTPSSAHSVVPNATGNFIRNCILKTFIFSTLEYANIIQAQLTDTHGGNIFCFFTLVVTECFLQGDGLQIIDCDTYKLLQPGKL